MPTYEQLKESRRVQEGLGIHFDGTSISPDTEDCVKLTGKSIGKLIIGEDGEKKIVPNTTIIEEENDNNK